LHRRRQNKEKNMLRKFAAALVATTLLAAPVFAAQPSGPAGAPPAATGTSVTPAAAPQSAHSTAAQIKSHKLVKRTRTHHRNHIARVKPATMHLARHFKSAKHRGHVAIHVAKPAKVTKHA
jgi:hypothetical protein